MAAIIVTIMISHLKIFSLIFFIKATPIKAPNRINGIITAVYFNVESEMVPQIKICKGTLIKFTKKKNQAAVPKNRCRIKDKDNKYTLITGPAAFPTMEENPAMIPTM